MFLITIISNIALQYGQIDFLYGVRENLDEKY